MRRHTRRGDKYARRDHRPDPRARPDRASPLAGCGPRPLQEGPQDLARPARPGLAPTGRGGGHETVSPGSRTPPAKRSPQPGRSWTPTRVASLAGAKLDECRRRIQHETTGRRDRADDPLHRARRTLHTGADLLTDPQAERPWALFANQRHAPVQAAWGVHQHPGPRPTAPTTRAWEST